MCVSIGRNFDGILPSVISFDIFVNSKIVLYGLIFDGYMSLTCNALANCADTSLVLPSSAIVHISKSGKRFITFLGFMLLSIFWHGLHIIFKSGMNS